MRGCFCRGRVVLNHEWFVPHTPYLISEHAILTIASQLQLQFTPEQLQPRRCVVPAYWSWLLRGRLWWPHLCLLCADVVPASLCWLLAGLI